MTYSEGKNEKELLSQCLNVVADTAVECATSFFKLSFHIREPWTVIDRLPGDFDRNFSLGNGNDQFQGIMTLGVTDSDLLSLLRHVKTSEALDVFGEMLNTFCGLLMDKETFTSRFGILVQSLPLYSTKEVYYPRAWACIGPIYTEQGISLHCGMALKPFKAILGV
jgi:hypothetical protein